MYTAKLIKREIDQGRYKWTVEFTDGDKTWTELYFEGKYEQVRNKVAHKLKDLNEFDTFTEGQDIDATIAVSTPTQAEIDRNEWLKDWAILQKANLLIDNGVIADTLPAYVAHKAKVSTNFKVGYINFL